VIALTGSDTDGADTNVGAEIPAVTQPGGETPTTGGGDTGGTTGGGDTGGSTSGGEDGAAVFQSAGCGSCHTFTPAGASGQVGPNLDDVSLDEAAIEDQVRTGGGGMPPFEGQLTDEQIQAVAAYVASGG
jgi:hypothetical protein